MGDENLHKGHRQRMFKKFVDNGIGCFEDHEQLEVLLFSIYPRCNTNEISHRLITRFGSLEKVFEASIDELRSVKDVGEQAAMRIRYFGEFIKSLTAKRPKNISLSSSRKMIDYCCSLYSLPISREIIYTLYLDSKYNLISQSEVGRGSTDFANLDAWTAVHDAMAAESVNIVLVHNHPSGSNIVSNADINATREFANLLQKLKLSLTDHIIVCGDTGHSLRSMELLKDIWS
ncbi:MAG: RadC family protein [Ruminococcaceae bacterium]|nr:RadC family protein [Oscillospiraceae bacterium]